MNYSALYIARATAERGRIEFRKLAEMHNLDAMDSTYSERSQGYSAGIANGYTMAADTLDTLIRMMSEGD